MYNYNGDPNMNGAFSDMSYQPNVNQNQQQPDMMSMMLRGVGQPVGGSPTGHEQMHTPMPQGDPRRLQQPPPPAPAPTMQNPGAPSMQQWIGAAGLPQVPGLSPSAAIMQHTDAVLAPPRPASQDQWAGQNPPMTRPTDIASTLGALAAKMSANAIAAVPQSSAPSYYPAPSQTSAPSRPAPQRPVAPSASYSNTPPVQRSSGGSYSNVPPTRTAPNGQYSNQPKQQAAPAGPPPPNAKLINGVPSAAPATVELPNRAPSKPPVSKKKAAPKEAVAGAGVWSKTKPAQPRSASGSVGGTVTPAPTTYDPAALPPYFHSGEGTYYPAPAAPGGFSVHAPAASRYSAPWAIDIATAGSVVPAALATRAARIARGRNALNAAVGSARASAKPTTQAGSVFKPLINNWLQANPIK